MAPAGVEEDEVHPAARRPRDGRASDGLMTTSADHHAPPRGAQPDPLQQRKHAVVIFDRGGAAFHPVAVVDVADGANLPHLGLVRMAANDTVGPTPAGCLIHCAIAEVGRVAHRPVEPILQASRQRTARAPSFRRSPLHQPSMRSAAW